MPPVRPTRSHAARNAFGLVALVLGLSSCNEIFNPCDDSTFSGEGQRARELQDNLLDGIWVLRVVNGRSLPDGGFALPSLNGERLGHGELNFYTFEIEEGTCEQPKRSRGEIIALYRIREANGTIRPTKTQVGSFTYDNASGVVTLSALGRSTTARRTGRSVIDVNAAIPVNFLGEITFDLQFIR